MPTPYEVLGVPEGASVDDAEDAYHRLLRREHPDLHHGEGPERLARAERRTRELNAAIWAIRAGSTSRIDVGAAAGATATEPPPGPATGPGAASPPGPDDPVWDDAAWEPDAHWDDDAHEWAPPSQPRPPTMASCPWCGRQFARAVDLKDHVFDDHDLRLDRRERGSLFGGRLRRLSRAAGHLPLWGVIPINLALAAVIGLIALGLTDETVAWWAAAITMSPTVVALVDRLFDISL